jgi:hypothetical protein
MDSVKNEVEAKGIKGLARALKRWWPAILLIAGLALSLVSENAFQWAKNKGWTTYTSANSGLADDQINALAIDGQGRVWIGTYGGLNFLDYDAGLVQVFSVIRIMLWITAGLGILVIVGTAIRRRGASATTKPVRVQPSEVSALSSTAAVATTPTEPIPTTPLVISEDPLAAFEQGQSLLREGKRAKAIEAFLVVFRATSDPALRQKALEQLETLGAVKKF